MKKLSRFLAILLAALTIVAVLPLGESVKAAETPAEPVVSASNAASSGKPRLIWETVEGAVEYEVYRATSKNGTYSLRKTTTGTSYTNTNATAGKYYYYFVRAIGADGAYTDSTVVGRTCDLPRPEVTAGNAASTGYVKLSWEAVEGAVEYKIYRSTSKEGSYKLMKTTSGASYTNTNAKNGTTYYYKVKAIAKKEAANSAYSAVKARACDLAQPDVEISLNSKGKPRLTWEAVENAAEYKVYRSSTGEDGSFSLMYTTSGTSYTNSKAEAGETYYYKVRAMSDNSGAHSAYSAMVSIEAGTASNLRYVKQPSTYLYEKPTSDSDCIKVPYMTELVLGDAVTNGSSGKWYEITYRGDLYYIWLTPDSDKLTTKQSSFDYTGETVYQQQVLDLAMTIYREWDTEYVSGESGEKHDDGTVGFDCSGFTCYVTNTVMQEHVPAYRLLPNTDSLCELDCVYNEDLPGEFNVIDVDLEDIQPGDMIFFNSDEGVLNHVGLYLGNNEFMHCTGTWDGVIIMPLTGTFVERFRCVRRFLPEEVTPANTTMYLTSGCKLYEDRKCEGEVLQKLSKGDAVTVLFTKPEHTAYVQAEDGTYGFVWLKYLSKTK